MQLKAYASCQSNEGWQVVRIPSSSNPDITYTILVSPWAANESICDCPSFMFRHGKCKHQQVAWEKVCRWTAKKSEEEVVTADGKALCPQCSNPVKYEVEVVDG